MTAIKKEIRGHPIYVDNIISELSTTLSAKSIGPVYRLIPNKCLITGCPSNPVQIPGP
jgi:Ni,Fe-hydrogenase III small subunit